MSNKIEENCGGISENATAYQVCVQETLRIEQSEAMWGWIGSGVMMVVFCIAIVAIIKYD